jgi:crotonobetainyl-CoA:carnitine CoA-transferase CaiB-like acyl-CoA transferase
VLESFGSMARTHLVDEQWAWAINPRLIWGSVSYAGRSGPGSEADGFDLLAQARCGLMSVTGFPDGPPTKTGNSLGDYLAGVHLAVGVIAALRHREVIGKGQLVDISLLEPVLACLDGFPMWNSIAKLVPRRAGNQHLVGQVAYASFACQDGYIVIATGGGSRLTPLVEQVLERPELLPLPDAGDPTFVGHVEQINAAITSWAQIRSTAEASSLLSAARVPNEPVRNLEEIWADSQLQSRGALLEYEYEELGAIKTIGSPMHLSESPVDVRYVPPAPGVHNEEVLGELLGYDADRLASLVERGVLWDWS